MPLITDVREAIRDILTADAEIAAFRDPQNAEVKFFTFDSADADLRFPSVEQPKVSDSPAILLTSTTGLSGFVGGTNVRRRRLYTFGIEGFVAHSSAFTIQPAEELFELVMDALDDGLGTLRASVNAVQRVLEVSGDLSPPVQATFRFQTFGVIIPVEVFRTPA